jgi:mycothiol synthase
VSAVTIRPARDEDAEAIAEVCNAASIALHGVPDLSPAAIRRWAEIPGLAQGVAELDGRVVGYVDVRKDAAGRYPIDVRAHPNVWGNGVAPALLAWAEEWSRERVDGAAVARGNAATEDRETRSALEAAGYRTVRHSFLMQIDLDGTEPAPVWPAGVELRPFEPGRDEQLAYDAHMEAFGDNWEFRPSPKDEWRASLIREDFDPSLWLLAYDGDAVAGFSLNAWHWSGDPAFGWVGLLGVRQPWRRRGLGLALLLHSFADFRSRGATRVGLGVDAENATGAVRLYERAGMRQVRRNDTWEKRL